MATDQNDHLLARAVALLEEIVRRLPEPGGAPAASVPRPSGRVPAKKTTAKKVTGD